MGNVPIKRILVVEDDQDYQLMVLESLKRMGYDCWGASGADEALERIRHEPFDLVLSDIRMKGKDGIELTRKVRGSYPDLEFIVMTGHAADYSYCDIINAGATDFLSKPFELGKLKAKIDRIERERNVLGRLKEVNDALALEVAVNGSIAELSRALLASSTMNEMSSLLTDHARLLTNSPMAYAGYVDPRTGRLADSAATERDEGKPTPDGTITTAEARCEFWNSVLDVHEPILSNETSEDARFSSAAGGMNPFSRILSVPSSVNETLLGLVAVADAEHDYTEKDLIIMKRLADIYGLAIQRMRTHDELRQTKEYLENVLENSAEAITIVNEHGKFVLWNKAAVRLLGYELKELDTAFMLYADPKELARMLEKLRRDGSVRRYEIDMKRKDGHVAPFEVSLSLLKDKNGRKSGSVGVAMDLSDLKRAMADLRDTNEQLQREIAERRRVEEELRKARDQLEILLEERTAKLSRAGEILKRSISRIKDITEE
jgi:PAS domain S-box-containing protein